MISAFTIPFALAIYWRKKPEFHRRLLLVASLCADRRDLGRFPPHLLPPVLFCAIADLLIRLGVALDLIVSRHVHQAYLYGLPTFMVGQSVVVYTVSHNSPYWLKIAHAILR